MHQPRQIFYSSTVSQEILNQVKEQINRMDRDCVEEPVLFTAFGVLEPEVAEILGFTFMGRIEIIHNNVYIKPPENTVKSQAGNFLGNSVGESEYVKRENFKSTGVNYWSFLMHTCGCIAVDCADYVFEACDQIPRSEIHVKVEFYKSTISLLESMVNALSPFQTFLISVGMKIIYRTRDKFKVIIRVLNRTPSNPPATERFERTAEAFEESTQIKARKTADYKVQEDCKKFDFERSQQLPPEWGVMLVDSVFVEIKRGIIIPDLVIRLNSVGDTFTIKSSKFYYLMQEYTKWWETREEKRQVSAIKYGKQ